jgi:hypothetical protein
MKTSEKPQQAFQLFDGANQKQRNMEVSKGPAFPMESSQRARFLLKKKPLKNKGTQTWEGDIRLVFLEHYSEPATAKYPEEKPTAVLKLPLSQRSPQLMSKAINT